MHATSRTYPSSWAGWAGYLEATLQQLVDRRLRPQEIPWTATAEDLERFREWVEAGAENVVTPVL